MTDKKAEKAAEAQTSVEDINNAAADEAVETEEVDPVAALEASLAEANDKFLRLQADYANYRKRMAKEVSQMRQIGVCDTLVPFLKVFDFFSMAVAAAEKSDNIAAIQQGLSMIEGEYAKALEELGVSRFDAVGEPFNPELHDAAANEESDAPEGTVIKQWNCGYRMGEKILRPARVVVSSGPAKAEEPSTDVPAEELSQDELAK